MKSFLLTLAVFIPSLILSRAGFEGSYIGTTPDANLRILSNGIVSHKPHMKGFLWGDNDPYDVTQVHIYPTIDYTSIKIMSVTQAPCNTSFTTIWPTNDPSSNHSFVATSGTYDSGIFGWNGTIYNSTITDLTPSTAYSYFVACVAPNGTTVTSDTFSFTSVSAPGANQTTYFATGGDVGTFVPFGFLVMDKIYNDHQEKPFDFFQIGGDVSYSTLNPSQTVDNEIAQVWDLMGALLEPIASSTYLVTTVGNHDMVIDLPEGGNVTREEFLANSSCCAAQSYTSRYVMPFNNGTQQFWYSFDFKNIHFVSISSEHPLDPGTPQNDWLIQDLAAANTPEQRAITPWIIASVHRPLFSSSTQGSAYPGGLYQRAYEAQIIGKVDVLMQHHVHAYERINPMINGTNIQFPQSGPNGDVYTSVVGQTPPLYLVQGMSGALQSENFISPSPPWSQVRLYEELGTYGYARFTATGASSLYGEVVSINGTILDRWTLQRT